MQVSIRAWHRPPARATLAALFVVAAICAGFPSAAAQARGQGGRAGRSQPPRDAQPPSSTPAGTASIVGSVIVAGTGAPARRARVSLSGNELRGGRSFTTDDQGRFAFTDLPAGRFTVSASKLGHVTATFGQRQPGSGRPGTPIQLGEGQHVTIQLQLPRGSVISGTILDEHGEPVPGTQVRVYRYSTQSGARTLQQAGADATDDRGMYRVYGLQPGEYLVGAMPRPQPPMGMPPALERVQGAVAALGARGGSAPQPAAAAMLERFGAGAADDEENTSGYAPVYYPGTTVVSGASSVAVSPGEERLGVDFQLQLVPLAQIEGIVISPSGADQANVQVVLVNTGDDGGGIGGDSARVDGDGRFHFAGVAPGQYTLLARTGPRGPMAPLGMAAGRGGRGGPVPGPALQGRGSRPTDASRLWATADVSVDGRNISNIALTLQPGFAVTGRVEFRGTTAQAPADLTSIRVALAPADVSMRGRQMATDAIGRVDETGRFTIEGVLPGLYRLTGSAGASGWTIESAVLGGLETLDFPLDIRSSQNLSGGLIAFTDRQASLAGAVTNDQGQPVSDYTLVLYPSDQRYWLPQSRRIRSARPATDGTFFFGSVPPGDYRLAPVLDPEPGAWFDPAFLQQLDGAALRVSIGDGERKLQNLRIGG